MIVYELIDMVTGEPRPSPATGYYCMRLDAAKAAQAALLDEGIEVVLVQVEDEDD